jgi:hypothetical protein
MSSPIGAAAKLGNPNPNPNLNLHGTGLDDRGLPVHPVQTVTGAMWQAAVNTLTLISALDEREGVVFCLENLNTAVDHPGTPFARVADTRALDQAVNRSHLRMNLDLCHAKIGAGNLNQRIRGSIDRIGEVQVADVPGRCEPGIGEINYPAIAAALHDARYTGVAGLEAWASGDSDTALQRFGDAFTPPAWIRCFGLRTRLYALLPMSVTRLRGLSLACGSCPTRDCIPCRSREHQCFDHRQGKEDREDDERDAERLVGAGAKPEGAGQAAAKAHQQRSDGDAESGAQLLDRRHQGVGVGHLLGPDIGERDAVVGSESDRPEGSAEHQQHKQQR